LHPTVGTITSFLTDGSLAALCAAMSRLTGATIRLIDPEGREIVMGDQDAPWHVRPPNAESPSLKAQLESGGTEPSLTPDAGRGVIPLVVRGRPIGALVIGSEAAPPTERPPDDLLRFAVEMLASTVSEFCEQSLEIGESHAELRILFRLSSLLVAARGIGAILHAALNSCVEAFSVDAGAVHLLDDDDGPLLLKAHTGLPPGFVTGAASLDTPAPGATSLAEREVETIRQLAFQSGFEGMITVALVFKEHPMGVLRLFCRESRTLDPAQSTLLQTIAEQVAAAVAGARLLESQRRTDALAHQLELAGDVQHRMLPQSPPAFPRLDIAARYLPSLELSGDFYDLIELNGHLGVVVGDVSGKGVPAALLMAAVRATLRAHAQDVFHLDELMARVNRAMVRDTRPHEFATIFYGVIDPKKLRLTYCNAGHDPPLVLQRADPKRASQAGLERLHELRTGGMIIGIDAAQTYERGIFDLSAGDTIVLSTDGLTDALNFQGDKFGRGRLKASLQGFVDANPKADAKAIAEHLVWEVRRFVGLNPQTDDITLVVIRAK